MSQDACREVSYRVIQLAAVTCSSPRPSFNYASGDCRVLPCSLEVNACNLLMSYEELAAVGDCDLQSDDNQPDAGYPCVRQGDSTSDLYLQCPRACR